MRESSAPFIHLITLSVPGTGLGSNLGCEQWPLPSETPGGSEWRVWVSSTEFQQWEVGGRTSAHPQAPSLK